jgi:hypothetical protein
MLAATLRTGMNQTGGITFNMNRIGKSVTAAQLREALREYMRRIAVEGGRKGGTARAKNMTAAERSEAARAAVRVRWAKAKAKKSS